MTSDDQTAPAAEWNPLATVDPIEVPLKSSGGRAFLVCRPWTGRERLAYEDAITERLLTTDERTGDDTVKLGSLKLFAVSLTIVGSKGFPLRNGRPMLSGTREEREDDLLAITDADAYREILDEALRVQPLPSIGKSDEDEETDDDEDPSRTPPTPAAGTDGREVDVVRGSLVE